MKQPKYRIVDSIAVVPAPAQAIFDGLEQIRKLIDARKSVDAWNLAKALHEKHPNHPVANYGMALALYNAGQKSAALPYAEFAVKNEPGNALYHLFLGKLYVDLQMLEFVRPVLERALALDKSMFQAPWILAEYYFGLSQSDTALEYYQKALAVVPIESTNRVKLDYATCLAAMGRFDEAKTFYSDLLDDPFSRKKALAGLALIEKQDHHSEVADQLRKELETPDLTEKDRSALLLHLGRLYENGREYDEAFHYFQESRKLLKNLRDIGLFRNEIDDKIKTITPDIVTRFREFGHSSTKPIFVVGMPRSGTTMTEQIIAAHSRAEGVGELKRMGAMAVKLAGNSGMAGILAKMTEFGSSRWKAVPQQYLNLLNVLVPDARYAVDKMPHNFIHLAFILFCFPNAKIIHCRRHPLDNFISAFQNKMNSSHGYAYDQVDYGEHYLEYMRLMDHWKAVFPGAIYESHYEKLTQTPEAEVRNMLEFLDLPWEEACLSFHDRQSTVKTFSRSQIRNPINTGSVARWRNYEKHLSPIISVFQKAGVQI